MLSSIHPLGERARRNRWWLTVTAFLVGAAVGGALMGGAFGLLGELLARWVDVSPVLVVLTFFVVLGTLVVDVGWFGLRVPSVRRQVDETWLNRYRGWVYGVGYGFQLGLGLVTVVSTAAVYGTAILALLTTSTVAGLAIGTTFGLVRGLAVLPGRVLTTPDRLRAFHRQLDQRRRLAARITPGAEVLVAIGLVTAMVLV
jgi:hypothetical protein